MRYHVESAGLRGKLVNRKSERVRSPRVAGARFFLQEGSSPSLSKTVQDYIDIGAPTLKGVEVGQRPGRLRKESAELRGEVVNHNFLPGCAKILQ